MPGKAAKVTITERQQEVLVEFRSAHTGERHLAQRAPMILWAFQGLKNELIARQAGVGGTKSASGGDAGSKPSRNSW